MAECVLSLLFDWTPASVAPRTGEPVMMRSGPYLAVGRWKNGGYWAPVSQIAAEHPFYPSHWTPVLAGAFDK